MGWMKKAIFVVYIPKIIVGPIAPMVEIPDDIMSEVVGHIAFSATAARQSAAIDEVEEVGIRLGSVGINGLIWTHVITPVHSSRCFGTRSRSMPMVCGIF